MSITGGGVDIDPPKITRIRKRQRRDKRLEQTRHLSKQTPILMIQRRSWWGSMAATEVYFLFAS